MLKRKSETKIFLTIRWTSLPSLRRLLTSILPILPTWVLNLLLNYKNNIARNTKDSVLTGPIIRP